MSQAVTEKQERVRVLVLGQTPPPFHGQAIMLERLVNGSLDGVELHHIRLEFSKSMDDVGRFRIGKVFHLFKVIGLVYIARIFQGIDTLYYPPSGPKRIPMWRDIVFLNLTRWLFRRVIFHMHAGGVSGLHQDLSGLSRWLYERAYYYPDAVIRMSKLTADDAVGLRAKSEFIVPNCADDERSRFPRNAESAGPPRLLYLGTVCETKGILDLLEACEKLNEDGVDFRLDVVGSFQPAEFEETVRRSIESRGLLQKVNVRGQLVGDEKFEALANSDVFCFPTYYPSEAFPCVVLEAMSFATPIVSTNWRGIPSIVEHGETGFLAEIRKVDELTYYLKELLLDEELRSRIGTRARQEFLDKYTNERHLQSMADVFRHVAGRRVDTTNDKKTLAVDSQR